MKFIWLAILCCSSFLLCLIIIKNKMKFRWIGTVAIHILIAAILLYLLNIIPVLEDFRIPINLATVATIALLGIPGFVLLIALQFFIL